MAQALGFVLDALFHLFILAALIRFWMQAFRAPTRNPIAQFSMAFTDFLVRPLRRVIPGAFNLDWASLVVALLAEFVLQCLLVLVAGAPLNGEILPVLLFLAFVKLIRLSIYIFMGAIIVGAVLSWVAQGNHPMAPFFVALGRPFMRPFQRAIPPIGGGRHHPRARPHRLPAGTHAPGHLARGPGDAHDPEVTALGPSRALRPPISAIRRFALSATARLS